MAMNLKNQNKCLVILRNTILDEPTHWQTIMNAVSKEMVIKNWLDVRGVLQWMLNQGEIRRINDVHTERYIKVGA